MRRRRRSWGYGEEQREEEVGHSAVQRALVPCYSAFQRTMKKNFSKSEYVCNAREGNRQRLAISDNTSPGFKHLTKVGREVYDAKLPDPMLVIRVHSVRILRC